MTDNSSNRKPTPLLRFLAFLAALIFLFISRNSDNEDMKTPILILIAGVFIVAFGAMIWHGVKEWKKTDEEILADYGRIADISIPDLGFLGVYGGMFATIVFLFNAWGTDAFLPACGFCCILWLLIGSPILYSRYIKKKAASSTYPTKPRITGAQISALLIGLVTCGFFCFLIGIGVYHGVWWFILPPGLIFLFNFSRPLVAAIRTMIRPPKSEDDPWDRPDIER